VIGTTAQRLAAVLEAAGPGGTVAFTGAGISTESGIPDFRGPGGLWTRYAPIEYSAYLGDPNQRRESWRRGLHTYAAIAAADPNPAHLALAHWWRDGLLNAVVTQNIDGLHQQAGLPDSAVVELHGNSHRVQCLACGAMYPRTEINARVADGEEDPACAVCGGMLKACTISFGQPLPEAAVSKAQALHKSASLCLVVGSSLVVYPAAALPELTVLSGGRLAIVNQSETHLDSRAIVVAREPAAVLLAEVESVLSS
jgi:NAD-dependent deacetylase